MKKCTMCKNNKNLKDFYPNKYNKDGFQSYCKSCSIDSNKKYIRTKKGLTTYIYHSQIYCSKKRNHILPNYTLEQLRKWIFSQPNFEELYNNWVKSGYQKMLKPSCDRLNDYKPYTLDNLRLVI